MSEEGEGHGEVLSVRVMDWITDTPSEQQSNIDLFLSFQKNRHLEIRLTGWTIHQNSRLHLGINTVPTLLLAARMSNLEEFTMDLECLSREPTLSTFCNLIGSTSCPTTLKKLTITCSGEEDMSSYSLRELGRAFQNISSITKLKLSGMDPQHLSTILYHMQSRKTCMARCLSCPCLPSSVLGNPSPCPRVLPQQAIDPYEVVPHQEDEEPEYPLQTDNEGYPQSLELQRVRLSHQTISNLIDLLSEASITHLTLRDCVSTSEDVEFLVYLLKGQSTSLQELTLDRLHIRTFHEAPAWWNASGNRSAPSFSKTSGTTGLKTVRLLDCKGSRKDLEAVTDALACNPGLQTLMLQYASAQTCSMTIHALNALYLATVVQNKTLPLRELAVSSAGPAYRLQQLATLLGHPLCRLERLTLDFGSRPCPLDVLADKLLDNSHLRFLSLSGDDAMDVATLEDFVTLLEDVPKLVALELDFPGIRASDNKVLAVLEANTTLEDIRILGSGDDSIHLVFFGLRNRLRKKLFSQQAWSIGTWNQVLQLLLQWQETSPSLQTCERLKEAVFTSALWFAFMECPLMVSELGPLLGDGQRGSSGPEQANAEAAEQVFGAKEGLVRRAVSR